MHKNTIALFGGSGQTGIPFLKAALGQYNMDKLVVFAMNNLAGKDARNALLDGIAHAQLLHESNTRWSIVRVPMLSNEPAKNKIAVGNVGQIKGFKLTPEDRAAFILQTIESNTYIHKMPFITNG